MNLDKEQLELVMQIVSNLTTTDLVLLGIGLIIGYFLFEVAKGLRRLFNAYIEGKAQHLEKDVAEDGVIGNKKD
jgi:hypothetical protein